MKNNKKKILVLIEGKNTFDGVLKSTINLAKIVNGNIRLLSVQEPLDVVKEANQLSAIRELNSHFISQNNEMAELADDAKLNFNITIECCYTVGPFKSEIDEAISSYKPDVIVISKGKKQFLNYNKNKLAKYVIEKFTGDIVVIDESKMIDNASFSIGIMNDLINENNEGIMDSLIQNTEKPIKSFKIGTPQENILNNKDKMAVDSIEFVFEKNDDSYINLANYINKNGINLLYLDRENILKTNKQDFNKIIDAVTAPLLISKRVVA